MRYIHLSKPIDVNGRPYTLLNLALDCLRLCPAFNADVIGAQRALSLKESVDTCIEEHTADLSEDEKAVWVPGEGVVWAVEEEPYRIFAEWCEKPTLPNGQSGYPVSPAWMLLPLIAPVKAATKDKPKPKEPEAPPAAPPEDGTEAKSESADAPAS